MKELWTEERRENHSELLKANYARDATRVESISKRFKGIVKTDAHRKKISIGLSGKAKSVESIIKLRWTRMGGSDLHSNYIDYCRDSYNEYNRCRNYSEVARAFNTSVQSVISAVNFWPRLNSYLELTGN